MIELKTAYHYGYFDYKSNPEHKELPLKVLAGLARHGVTLDELKQSYLRGRHDARRSRGLNPRTF